MEEKFVITIGRQFGSGGREIGLMISRLLGIGYYDRRLISEAAKRSGLSSEAFEENDEKVPGTLRYAFSFGFGFNNAFLQESLFKIQSDTILDIASRESCVIVGRCADYVLRENPRCVNLFIHAPFPYLVGNVASRTNISEKEAAEMIQKVNKTRAAYYDFYTEKQWGVSASYHLSIDSSIMGTEKTAAFLKEFAETTLKERK